MEIPEVKIVHPSPRPPDQPRDWGAIQAGGSNNATAAADAGFSINPGTNFMQTVLSSMLQPQPQQQSSADQRLDLDLDIMRHAYESGLPSEHPEGLGRFAEDHRYSSFSDRIVAAALGNGSSLEQSAGPFSTQTDLLLEKALGGLRVKNTFLSAGTARRTRTESCDAVLEGSQPEAAPSAGGAANGASLGLNDACQLFSELSSPPSPHHAGPTLSDLLPPMQPRSRYESCDSSHLFDCPATQTLPEGAQPGSDGAAPGSPGPAMPSHSQPLYYLGDSFAAASPPYGSGQNVFHAEVVNDFGSTPRRTAPTYEAWTPGNFHDQLVKSMLVAPQLRQQPFTPSFPFPSGVETDQRQIFGPPPSDGFGSAASSEWGFSTASPRQPVGAVTPEGTPATAQAAAAGPRGSNAGETPPPPSGKNSTATTPKGKKNANNKNHGPGKKTVSSRRSSNKQAEKVGTQRSQKQQHSQVDEEGSTVPEGAPIRPEDMSRQVTSGMTTIMLRNIPNKYTQKMLLDVINEKFRGLYDFFYLPIDFRNKCNVGYAFINFLHSNYATMFKKEFDGLKLSAFKSNKVCEVSWGRVQGLAANIEHYRNSAVMSIPVAQFKPLLFKNGVPVPFPVADGPLPSVKLRPQKC